MFGSKMVVLNSILERARAVLRPAGPPPMMRTSQTGIVDNVFCYGVRTRLRLRVMREKFV